MKKFEVQQLPSDVRRISNYVNLKIQLTQKLISFNTNNLTYFTQNSLLKKIKNTENLFFKFLKYSLFFSYFITNVLK